MTAMERAREAVTEIRDATEMRGPKSGPWKLLRPRDLETLADIAAAGLELREAVGVLAGTCVFVDADGHTCPERTGQTYQRCVYCHIREGARAYDAAITAAVASAGREGE